MIVRNAFLLFLLLPLPVSATGIWERTYERDLDGFPERAGGRLDEPSAVFLNPWWMDQKHAPAGFELAQNYRTHDGKFDERRLERAAEAGDLSAIKEMAWRHLHGDGVTRNRGVGWYWLKRAQQMNVDPSSITPISLNRLLEEMDENERSALIYLAHYHDDLDLAGVEIPQSFLPLTDEVPEPLSDREVAAFMERFHGLSRKADNESYNAIERELVARTAGIRYLGNVSIDAQFRPFGMSNDEFVQRKCNYHRAIGRIFPQGRDQAGEQLRRRQMALSSLFEDKFKRYISDVIQCGRIYPVTESQRFSEALTWAKELERMDAAALRKIAKIHVEKSRSLSKRKYKPNPSVVNAGNEFEFLMHFQLSKSIFEFAEHIAKK